MVGVTSPSVPAALLAAGSDGNFEKLKPTDAVASSSTAGASKLAEIIEALSADPATKIYLDPERTPEEHVGVAVREQRVGEALRQARGAADTLSSNVRDEVVHRKEALLAEVDAVTALEKEVTTVSSGVSALASASTALADALSGPYVPMSQALVTLKNIREASKLLRAVSRFRYCTSKLADAALFPTISVANRTPVESLPAAAEAVRELEELLTPGGSAPHGFDKVDLVAKNTQAVRRAGLELRRRSSAILKSGIAARDQSSVSATVSAFRALGILPERVNGEISRLLSETQAAIQRGLDPPRVGSALSLSAAFGGVGPVASSRDSWKGSTYDEKGSSGVLSERQKQQGAAPTSDTGVRGLPSEIWDRLDDMLETIRDHCSKAVLLQQVLSRKHDDVSHVSLLHEPIASAFIDAVGKSLGEQIVSLSRTHRQRAGGAQVFRTITSEYPRLRASLVSVSERIHTLLRGAPYPITVIEPHGKLPIVPDCSFIEGTFVSAVREVESHYLTASLERLTSAATSLFGSNRPGGPGEAEAVGLVRLLAAELSASRSAPDLFQTSIVNAATVLRLYLSHVQDFAAENAPDVDEQSNHGTVVHDWPLLRVYNGLIALINAAKRLLGIDEDGSGKLPTPIANEVSSLYKLSDVLLDGPFSACSIHVTRAIQRIHTEDLTSSRGVEDGCSLYAVDVGAQLSMFSDGAIQKIARSRSLGVATKKLGCHVLDVFVQHASLAFPLPEAARFRLATDMARIELAVESLCPVRSLGESYLAIRSMRNLVIFSDDDLVSSTPSTVCTLSHLRPSFVAYHLFSRSSDAMLEHPHRRDNLTPAEFVDWLGAHSEDEAWYGVQKSVQNYEASLDPAIASRTIVCAQYQALNSLSVTLRKDWSKGQARRNW
jgi:hypothetical protein